MRIIAGTHRGRRLVAPEGLTTRPMTDRVRENLFNILGQTLEGAVVLDLFCGSGALGLEALSRWAVFCMFVDADRDAVAAAQANAAQLGLAERARFMRHDALRPGPRIRPPGRQGYTLLFIDPPYKMSAEPQGQAGLADMVAGLLGLGCVAPGAVAMIRTKRGTAIDLPWAGFVLADTRSYGTTTLHLMTRSAT